MILKHFTTNHIKLDEIESTNSYLQDLNSKKKEQNGTVVSAINQTKGKGQVGNMWEVESGKNLTFSVLTYPKIKPQKAFYLNIIASLSVCKVLSDLKINSEIKWPNDILVAGKKICGILIENQISGNEITQSIIGIGLNVNQVKFSKDIKGTSIFNQNISVSVDDVLTQIHGYLDFYYNLLLESNFKILIKLYYQHMFLYQKKGVFIDGENEFTAIVNGVSEVGLLELQLLTGIIKSYDLKEVKFVY